MVLALLLPLEARGEDALTVARCIAIANEVPALQDGGHLLEARRRGAQCARSECPAVVRDECVRLVESSSAMQPTVLIAATDAAGADLTDVDVAIDDAGFQRADGRELDLDPGPHRVRFRRGKETREQTVVMQVGAKRRRLDVRFSERSTTTAPSTEEQRSVVLPWVVLGAGLVSVGVGAYLHVKTAGDVDDLERTCGPRCDPELVSPLKTRYATAVVLYVVGGAAIAGGLVLYLAGRPPTSSRAIHVGANGVVFRAAF